MPGVAAWRRWAAWIASLLISAALLGYLFSDVEPALVMTTARGMAPAPFAAFVAIFLVGVVARACRFWILLARTVPLPLLIAITLVRNLFVDLLPARVGELSYVYLLTSRARRPAEEGVATLAVAFLLDIIALAPLLVIAVLLVGGTAEIPTAVLVIVAALLALAGGVAVRVAAPAVRLAARWLEGDGTSARRVQFSARGARLAASLDRLRHALLPAFALSVVVRLCKYGSAYLLFLSILIPLGYTSADLGVARVFLGQLTAEIAASLPIHGIAGFGTYEAAWTFTLERFGLAREDAVISGVLGHAIGQLLEYLLAALAWIWLLRRTSATGRT